MKRLLMLLYVTLLITACSGKAESQTQNTAVSDPAVPLEVTVGSEFRIVLDSNPSTGYHWEISDDLDKTSVEFVSNDYEGDEPVAPGSGGRDILTFKALKTGETHITLLYYPPSGGAGEPQQKVTFTVTVK